MADDISGIAEAMRKVSEAFADAMSAVSKSIQGAASGAAIPDRERMIESWLRIARMSKDGVITAMEQGFEAWEREVRRMSGRGSGGSKASTNPLDAWAENLRKATESFMGTGGSSFADEARKQAESVQKTVTEGIRAWQRIWEKS
jgi:hypothetical protein